MKATWCVCFSHNCEKLLRIPLWQVLNFFVLWYFSESTRDLALHFLCFLLCLIFCFCAVIMDSMYNNKELFLTQNSFSEEILQQNFSIDSILDGLVDSDEPAPQNSWAKELKQVVTKEYIKDGQTDPSNCPEVVRKILIVDNEELDKRKESRIPPNTRINTLWAVGSSYLVWISSGVKQNDRNQSQILPNTRINTLWAVHTLSE